MYNLVYLHVKESYHNENEDQFSIRISTLPSPTAEIIIKILINSSWSLYTFSPQRIHLQTSVRAV